MAGHECYHCKHWVEAGEPHDCWTTTEAALTEDLTEDLRDAWDRLRETAAFLLKAPRTLQFLWCDQGRNRCMPGKAARSRSESAASKEVADSFFHGRIAGWWRVDCYSDRSM